MRLGFSADLKKDRKARASKEPEQQRKSRGSEEQQQKSKSREAMQEEQEQQSKNLLTVVLRPAMFLVCLLRRLQALPR